jgi:von Willebrand factor A domain-containing protein 8
LEDERKIFRIKENFRIIALAEPPNLTGSGKGQWLTPEVLSMFLFHSMRPLSQEEEIAVLSK